ncbi:MAG TPA: efflux RND transporter periplasmic adaptor subunit [Candidatus Paceibacterota bacterium]|nr:efflux RND transporter periplasmic adaptor subunit [Candidatus Paceibacterota bacterium]
MKLKLFSILLTAGALALAGCGKSDTHSDAHESGVSAKAAKYHCPMHPTYVSDKPGDCPICGMKLVPIDGDTTSAPTASIPGRVSIALSAEKRNLIGLTLSPVEKRDLTRMLRNPGTVIHDETRFARISPRFGGWVRSLQVNYTGQHVEKGEPLFTVYSPELFTAENDYLLAWKNAQLTNAPAAMQDSGRQLLETARHKLELLLVNDEEIRSLEQSGKATDQLQIRAPLSGHVITKNAVEGQAFNAGETLYEIADLSRLWIRAAVYESDLPQIKIGQKAQVTFPNLNNKTIESSVTFIYPHIDPQTRRAEVRLEIENPNHEIRPEMWADVEINVELGNVLAVPASSVIDTGARYVAFVDADKDHLEPREVKIGAKTEDYFEVLGGLKEGEKVVTRALFLVDSESQLKSAISGMSATGEHKH